MEEKWHLAKETHLPAQGLIAYEYTSNVDDSVPLEPVEVKDNKKNKKKHGSEVLRRKQYVKWYASFC